MKQSLVFAALGLAAVGVAAQEVGTVISSTPIVQQVAVPRQACYQQPMVVQQQPSGAGGLLGAIAGAAIGSQFGGGSGRGAAMVAGTVGGALLGNNMEAQGQGGYVQNVPQCTTQTAYENRTVAWNVTYEYAGRRHTVQMPYDPGPTVRLQVTPVGGGDYRQPDMANAGPSGGPVVVAPPIQPQAQAQGLAEPQPYPAQPAYGYAQPAVVATAVAPAPIVYQQYQTYPAYPAYSAYPTYPAYRAYPPIGISLGFGFGGGHRHHRHR